MFTCPERVLPIPLNFEVRTSRMVRTSGKPVAQIARQLEVAHETVRAWVRQADIDDGLRHNGLTTEETVEVRRLRREVKTLRNRTLTMPNETLTGR